MIERKSIRRLAPFAEAPLSAFGTASGPWLERVNRGPLGFVAGMMAGKPSLSILPVTKIERYWPSVRVRMWCANESGSVWLSAGYYTIKLHRFVVLKARSRWRRWRDFPDAHVVVR